MSFFRLRQSIAAPDAAGFSRWLQGSVMLGGMEACLLCFDPLSFGKPLQPWLSAAIGASAGAVAVAVVHPVRIGAMSDVPRTLRVILAIFLNVASIAILFGTAAYLLAV